MPRSKEQGRNGSRGVAEEQNPPGSKSQAYFIRLVETGWVEDGKEVAPAESWRRIGTIAIFFFFLQVNASLTATLPNELGS